MSLFDTLNGGILQAGQALVGGAAQNAFNALTSTIGIGRVLPSKFPSNFTKPDLRLGYDVTIYRAGTPDSTQQNPDRMILVNANLPDEFDYTFKSDWMQPFSDNRISEWVNVLGQVSGHKWVTQGMSTQFWSGSSPVNFNMELVFVAEKGPADLMQPLIDLYTLVLPSLSGGFYKAPGPKLKISTQAANAASSAYSSGKQAMLNLINGQGTPSFSFSDSVSGAITAMPKSLSDIGSALQQGAQATTSAFTFEGEIALHIGKFMVIPSIVIESVSNNFKVIMTRDFIPVAISVKVDCVTHNNPSIEDVQKWFQPGTQSAQPSSAPGLGLNTIGSQLLNMVA